MTIEPAPTLFDVVPAVDGDDRTPLLPVRHPNQDLFICDVLDAIPKDDMASMEHPVFSLSTKPDNRTRRYEHNGNVIEIIPSGKGLATIHDKDILIYCISQLIAKMNQGEAPSRTVRLQAYDMLVATNRQTSGEGYRLMTDALTRLRGTTVRTNIRTGGVEETRIFGLIEEAIKGIDGIQQSAYVLFLQSIPFSFYPFLAIFFVFLVVLSGRDFGPMYKAEIRARSTGAVTRSDAKKSNDRQMDDFEEKQDIPCLAVNALIPIGCLIAGVIGGMYISGEGESLQDIVGSANAYVVLIWASLLACMAAFILTLSQGLLTLNEAVEAWIIGARFMLTGLVLLVMAWAVADVTNILQTAAYLISLLGDSLSPQMLPTFIFLLAAAAGFASGSSWGVMAILMPLVIPLSWAVLEIHGINDSEHLHILYSSIACVLCGAVWADHCSPLSDTTVLSSLASGCDHMDHVTTQLPYALLTGSVAMLICTLPGGYGLPWWLLLLSGALMLFMVHRFLARPTNRFTQAISESD